jgi:oligoribonuclease
MTPVQNTHLPRTPSAEALLLKKSDQNLVWLDCEMTGLDADKERLLEIAIIVTSPDLSVRIEGPVFVIHQSV